MMLPTLAAVLLVSSLSIGCSAGRTPRSTTTAVTPEPASTAVVPPGPQAPVIEVEALRIRVVRDDEGNQQVISLDARDLFDEGNDALALGDHDRALRSYDNLQADFPDSSLAGPALFNAGLALEGLGRFDEAISRYQNLADSRPASTDGVDARIRISAVLAERKRWGAAIESLDALLALHSLSASDRLEGMARRGYVLLEARDFAAAEVMLREAISYYASESQRGKAFEGDYFAGMAHFYLADIPRRQFDAISIRLPDKQIARDVEAKAELVILASDRFGDAVEFGNIYWATAAGFRLASMQRNFWISLVQAPIPPQLNQQESSIYVEEVHRQSLSLLEKSLSIHERNVVLAEHYNTNTPWSRASATEVVAITKVIGRERAGDLLSAKEAGESGAMTTSGEGEYLPARIDL